MNTQGSMLDSDSRIFVAGHRGMVGSAIVRRLEAFGFKNVITAGRAELNLLDQKATHMALPIHMEAIKPQNNSGLLVMTCGPGWML